MELNLTSAFAAVVLVGIPAATLGYVAHKMGMKELEPVKVKTEQPSSPKF